MICEYCQESESPIRFHRVIYLKRAADGHMRPSNQTGLACFNCMGWFTDKRDYEKEETT